MVRGPVANIYGSGAIGGVVSFRTKDVDDILRPGQVWGTQLHTLFGSNSGQALGSAFGAARLGPNVDVMVGGSARTSDNYKDGDGNVVDNTGYDLQSGHRQDHGASGRRPPGQADGESTAAHRLS